MELRHAVEGELSQVCSLYWTTIEMLKDTTDSPDWVKGVHPTEDFIRAAIQAHTLYVAVEDHTPVAAMVMDHSCPDAYDKVRWGVSAPRDEVLTIHILTVSPAYHRRGIASFLIREAVRIGREDHQKAIRLDVLGQNLPAQRMYEKTGFRHRDTIQLYYKNTGLTDFLLYEYLL